MVDGGDGDWMSGRIRTIKPELLEDEKTGSLDDGPWRLFVSLLVLADDYGNLRADPRQIAGQAFWARLDRCDAGAWLAELVGVGLVQLYAARGQVYCHINGWEKHQKVNHPGKPRCPGPSDADDSRESQEALKRVSCLTPDPDPRPVPPTSTTDPECSVLENRGAVQQALVPLSPPVLTVPLANGTEHPITEADVQEWTRDFPGVDVPQELRKLRQWNLSRPRNRKTARGIRAHITDWLGREQNRSRGTSPPGLTRKGEEVRKALAAGDPNMFPEFSRAPK